MRLGLLFLSCITGVTVSYSQQIDLLQIADMKGDVESITLLKWGEDTTNAPNEINRTFFDIKGRAWLAEREKPNSFIHQLTLTYNEQGLVSEEKYSSTDETRYERYFYDDSHEESIYFYEFDHYGNWIKKTAFLYDKFWLMEKRKITYYE